jgi:O-antigen/teichoic acid export membrane protein
MIYGEVVLLQGLGYLGSSTFCSPFLAAALRFYPDAVRAGRGRQMRNFFIRLLRLSTAGVMSALLLGGTIWTAWIAPGMSFLGFLTVAALVAVEVPRSFESNLLNAARHQGVNAAWSALDAWAKPLAAAALVLAAGASAAWVLLGFAVGTAVVWAAFRGRLIRFPDRPENGSVQSWATVNRGEVFRYAAPIVPLSILSWLTSLSDRYILAGWSGPGVAGVYAAAYGLASQPFITLSLIVSATLRPVLFDAVANGDASRERRTIVLWIAAILGTSLVGVVLMSALAPWIVRITLGKSFWDSAVLIPWISAAYAIQSVQNIFETIMFARSKTRRLVVMQIVGTAAALLFYFLLIPPLGALGAAIASCVSLAASCVASIWLSEMTGELLRLVRFRRSP